MITVKPVPVQAFQPLRSNEQYGWIHTCGRATFSADMPIACAPCRDPREPRNHAHLTGWRLIYVTTDIPTGESS